MKYRDYKVFAPGGYYHVYNRGVAKTDIFLDDDDRKFFLFRLKEYLFPLKGLFKGKRQNLPGGAAIVAETHTPYKRKMLPPDSFSLLCYCLMPNHFHFLIRQEGVLEVRKLLAKVCTSYSKFFNQKYGRVGSLFQDAFKAISVENDPQLLWVSSYIHNNPKTANLVDNLTDYPWSSYLDYIGKRQGTLCDKEFILKMIGGAEKYKRFAEDSFAKIKERKDCEGLFLD
ncbi:MAG: transposase [Patescibacteria group bacterium]|nr:transposase [Patescibacteria group bacterium]